MVQFLFDLMRPEVIFTLLVGLAVFGTLITVTAPMLVSDKLKSRMKGVTIERDKLRAQQRATLEGGNTRLRQKAKTSFYQRIVDTFNLRDIFASEGARDLLRQAGFRGENHMITFLASRVIAPIVLGVVAFVYSNFLLGDRLTSSMRIVATVGAVGLGFFMPIIILKNFAQKRQQSIKRAWSDALDLLLICVESGMALEPSLARVAREIGSQSVPLAEELTLTVAELSYLQDRRKAFENLGRRTGLETVRSVVTTLIQSERYGTPLGSALRVLAQENRDTRMSDAEKKAAALPPKLTVPMILFFLPVIFVVLLGPALILVFKAG
jgi:tight adherence protein C